MSLESEARKQLHDRIAAREEVDHREVTESYLRRLVQFNKAVEKLFEPYGEELDYLEEDPLVGDKPCYFTDEFRFTMADRSIWDLMVWKICPKCGEHWRQIGKISKWDDFVGLVDDEADICWNCQQQDCEEQPTETPQPKPESPKDRVYRLLSELVFAVQNEMQDGD
jgi:hypothetical protein